MAFTRSGTTWITSGSPGRAPCILAISSDTKEVKATRFSAAAFNASLNFAEVAGCWPL